GVFSGGITLNGTATVKMQDWWGTTVRNGLISGQVTGTGGLSVNSGSGSGALLTLNNNTNNYSGGTAISAAKVLASASNALGTGAVSVTGTNGQLQLGNGVNVANDLAIDGGGVVAEGVLHAVGNATYSGNVTINAAASAGSYRSEERRVGEEW